MLDIALRCLALSISCMAVPLIWCWRESGNTDRAVETWYDHLTGWKSYTVNGFLLLSFVLFCCAIAAFCTSAAVAVSKVLITWKP